MDWEILVVVYTGILPPVFFNLDLYLCACVCRRWFWLDILRQQMHEEWLSQKTLYISSKWMYICGTRIVPTDTDNSMSSKIVDMVISVLNFLTSDSKLISWLENLDFWKKREIRQLILMAMVLFKNSCFYKAPYYACCYRRFDLICI